MSGRAKLSAPEVAAVLSRLRVLWAGSAEAPAIRSATGDFCEALRLTDASAEDFWRACGYDVTFAEIRRHAGRIVLVIALFLLALPTLAWDRPRWGDIDGDGKDTRAEILEARCSHVTWRGKHVAHAVCIDAYTGAEVATDTAPQSLQIDHLYPASLAWARGIWKLDSGAPCITPTACPAFRSFYDSWGNLNVTRSATNERKSDLMPGAWCPEEASVRPAVARQFRAVVATWHLPLLPAEEAGLRAWERGECR